MPRYCHRDNLDHHHPAKDWVGLFFLQDVPTTTPVATAGDHTPKNRVSDSSCEYIPLATTAAARNILTSKPSRHPVDQTNASTTITAAAVLGTSPYAAGPQPSTHLTSTSPSTIAKDIDVKGSRELATAPPDASELEHEVCVGNGGSGDGKRGTSQKHKVSIDSSKGGAPIDSEGTTTAQSGDMKHDKEPAATKETKSGSGSGSGNGSGNLFRETMVGWRTLPPENKVTRGRRRGGGWRV